MVITIINPKQEALYGRFTNSDQKFIEFCLFLKKDCKSFNDLLVCIDSPTSHFEVPLTDIVRMIE